ncbi:MAG: protein kinase [Vicinamibacterales bacterium]
MISLVGAGGMGEVYRARDMKLQREVALKVLPVALAGDAERLARFRREAQTLAALNHPHIAQVHGLESADDTLALVMEFVEGEDLAQVVSRGPVPVDEALAIADQIADGLDAAHAIGIVHRDLKPANLKVKADGTVKVLDFGLAKAFETNPMSTTADNSPTITTPAMTRAGVILGTAAYMSPEQARVKAVDRRTDVWSFGCVLFELLTGRRAFDGETIPDVLAAIVHKEPDWTLLPPSLPEAVRRVLQRCLEKDVRKRVSQVAVVRYAIEGSAPPIASSSPSGVKVPTWNRAWVLVAGTVLAATAFAAGWKVGPITNPVVARETVRFDLNLPPSVSLAPVGGSGIAELALSPDGTILAFTGVDAASKRLWLRRFDTGELRALPGTDGAENPIWSPDGQRLAYRTGSTLKFVGVQGDAIQLAASIPTEWGVNIWGGTWGTNGVILLGNRTPVDGRGLIRVDATSGAVQVETTCDQGCQNHTQPVFLDDGRRYLFVRQGHERGVWLGTLSSMSVEQVLADPTAVAIGGGRLFHVDPNRQALLSTAFDSATGRITGSSSSIAGPVGLSAVTGRASFSVSRSGSLIWTAMPNATRRLVVVDRRGEPAGRDLAEGRLSTMKVSPDGRVVVYGNRADGEVSQNLWLADMARGTTTRLTFLQAGNASDGRWSPDMSQLAFTFDSGSNRLIKIVSAFGGEPRTLAVDQLQPSVDDWTPDGQFIIYHAISSRELWAARVDGKAAPMLLVKPAAGRIDQPSVSPDNKWLVFQTEEGGRSEVYVSPFLKADRRWQVSAEGGVQPTWSHDGRELFFAALDGSLMSVRVTPKGDGLEFGTPQALFDLGFVPTFGTEQYDVLPDGRGFLVMKPQGERDSDASRILSVWLNAVGPTP